MLRFVLASRPATALAMANHDGRRLTLTAVTSPSSSSLVFSPIRHSPSGVYLNNKIQCQCCWMSSKFAMEDTEDKLSSQSPSSMEENQLLTKHESTSSKVSSYSSQPPNQPQRDSSSQHGSVQSSRTNGTRTDPDTDPLEAYFQKRVANLQELKHKSKKVPSQYHEEQREQLTSKGQTTLQEKHEQNGNLDANFEKDSKLSRLMDALSKRPNVGASHHQPPRHFFPRQQQQEQKRQPRNEFQRHQQQQTNQHSRPQKEKLSLAATLERQRQKLRKPRTDSGKPWQQNQQQQLQLQRQLQRQPPNMREQEQQQQHQRRIGERNRKSNTNLADLMNLLRHNLNNPTPRSNDPQKSQTADLNPLPGWRRPRKESNQDSTNPIVGRQNRAAWYKGGTTKEDTFLGGRAGRSENNQNEVDDDDIKDWVVKLPTREMTLTEVSGLFRIQVAALERKLRDMGEDPHAAMEDGGELKLDLDMLELLGAEYGIITERSESSTELGDEEMLLQRRGFSSTAEDDSISTVAVPMTNSFPPRPPVVCIMGHVDHGKTTLMDSLRRRSREQTGTSKKNAGGKGGKKNPKLANRSKSGDVAGTEAGGITQIISAFQVALGSKPGNGDSSETDSIVTFLDTPGHAAFRAMRQSGSHAADIIVLVIAADDGVSPQTVEIIDFYKSIVSGSNDDGISLVVALNKIDKPGIDVDQARFEIENQLLEHGIVAEGLNGAGLAFGPPVQVIPTSGLTGEGIDELMEGLILQSEMMDLRADDEARAEGVVMDARVEKGGGIVVDCIIRWGKVQKGDIVVSGTQIGKVKVLRDVNDKAIKDGLPSQPVRISGFKSLPKAGDPIMCVGSEKEAEKIVERREAVRVDSLSSQPSTRRDLEVQVPGMQRQSSSRLDTINERLEEGNAGICDDGASFRIPILIKADADGSLAALRDSLIRLGEESKHHRILVQPISEGIGTVTAADVLAAKESNAVIFAFGLSSGGIDNSVLRMAEMEGVSVRNNDIIYSLLDDAKDAYADYLPLVEVEQVHGRATVQSIFEISNNGSKEKVAGLKVYDGHLYKDMAPFKSSTSSKTKYLKSQFRVLRGGEVISPEERKIVAASLRRFKEIVDVVRQGEECGLGFEEFDVFEEGDVIECFSIDMQKAKI